MSRFQFVAENSTTYPVKRLCELVEIERSSYYAWQTGTPARSARAASDGELLERIRIIHAEDDAQGVPRITAELNDGAALEDRVNHKRVARVMADNRITGIRLRRRVRTTTPKPADQLVPDLLERDFTAEQPNAKYVGTSPTCPAPRAPTCTWRR